MEESDTCLNFENVVCFEFKKLILLKNSMSRIEMFFIVTNAKIYIDVLHSCPFYDSEVYAISSLLGSLFKMNLLKEKRLGS